jgi:hypothetical protein
MHGRGLAIDVTCDGISITSRTDGGAGAAATAGSLRTSTTGPPADAPRAAWTLPRPIIQRTLNNRRPLGGVDGARRTPGVAAEATSPNQGL